MNPEGQGHKTQRTGSGLRSRENIYPPHKEEKGEDRRGLGRLVASIQAMRW